MILYETLQARGLLQRVVVSFHQVKSSSNNEKVCYG